MLDLTPRRVYQLTTEGIIPKAARGRYELVPVVRGYIKYLRDRAINADVKDGDADHRKRLTKARADIAEMEAEQLAGSLVPVDRAEQVWTDAVANFRQRTLAVAHKAAPMVAVEKDIDQCHEIIEAHLYEALAELAGTRIDVENPEPAAQSFDGDVEGDQSASETDDIRMGWSLSPPVI